MKEKPHFKNNLIRNATLLALFLGSYNAKAEEVNAMEIRGPQKATPVTILQNRYFVKQWRPEFGVLVGTFMNESYTDTQSYGARGAIYISEWLGFEGQFIETKVKQSDDRRALNEKKYRRVDTEEVVSPDPEVNMIHKITDANAIIAPFYGKLNLLDQAIIYSDLYLNVGFSKVATDQGDLNAAIIGVGERFYWKKSFAFRIDYRDRIFQEKRGGREVTKHSYNVDLGVSYFFM
jgi:outer membrane beta-barrel protein